MAVNTTKGAKKGMKASINTACVVTLFNLILFGASALLFYSTRYHTTVVEEKLSPVRQKPDLAEHIAAPVLSNTALERTSMKNTESKQYDERPPLPECTDSVWCNIPMPTVSYYRFDPPTDPYKWRLAQIQASRGEQVLLKRLVATFPGHSDFLDGDITFRKLHSMFDFFVDDVRDLSPLVPPVTVTSHTAKSQRKLAAAAAPAANGRPALVNGKMQYSWDLENKRVIPEPYDFRSANRSAVVSIGYTAYTRDQQTYFSGNRVGGAFVDRNKFFQYWRNVKDRIDLPFISICTLNENWGMISTRFPNRTAGWGRCCDQPKDSVVREFLDHPKTLMFVTNQHVNVSHPKLMIMPRGIPLTWGFTRFMIWDAMRNTLKHTRKQSLLFAAASGWGPRPQILKCVSDHVPVELFDGHVDTPKTARLGREQYYNKLGSAMFGLGLPGLGYDCFR